MSVNQPVVVDASNLSTAWGEMLVHAHDSKASERCPILVCVSDFTPPLPLENMQIRSELDKTLVACDKNTVESSAAMIFPYGLWLRRGRPSCDEFSKLCVDRLFPRLKALDQRNRLGTYFERMMAFTGWQRGQAKTVNQLSHIIGLLKNEARWPRKSALQIALLDPAKDHTRQPVRGFPCLQQVSVTHDGDNRLALNAFYPTQYIFDRGYGNYLGLCHLGAFIAHETQLTFSRLNCFVGEPQLGNVPKGKLSNLIKLIRGQSKGKSDCGETDER